MFLDDKTHSKFFKAFGDLSRIKILKMLAKKSLTVNEIVAKMNITQSTVSRHLAVLKEAGIVLDTRQGQQIMYSLNKKEVGICCNSLCLTLKVDLKPEKSGKKAEKAKK